MDFSRASFKEHISKSHVVMHLCLSLEIGTTESYECLILDYATMALSNIKSGKLNLPNSHQIKFISMVAEWNLLVISEK
jgi:hypothetical protein